MRRIALFDASRPLEIADQGVFSIPGRYVEVDKRTIMIGQMYVQYQIPKNKTRPYPVVMIHGGGQTASNFLATPDGRRGWADDFVANGYAVYVVDQVGRGRSGFFTDSLRQDAQALGRERDVALHRADRKQLWPQAEPAHPMAGNRHAGRSGLRHLLRHPGRDASATRC